MARRPPEATPSIPIKRRPRPVTRPALAVDRAPPPRRHRTGGNPAPGRRWTCGIEAMTRPRIYFAPLSTHLAETMTAGPRDVSAYSLGFQLWRRQRGALNAAIFSNSARSPRERLLPTAGVNTTSTDWAE